MATIRNTQVDNMDEEAMNRLNAYSEKQKYNIKTTLDEQGGLVIKGGPALKGSLYYKDESSFSLAPEDMSYENFAKARSSLSSITDIEQRGIKVAELIGSVQAHARKQYGDIADTANRMYGVQELEKTLQQAIEEDKADPSYHLFLSDSPITAKIRTDLDQARQNATIKSKDLYDQNPELARLETEAKMLAESEVRLMNLMENRLYRAEAKADVKAQKDEDKAMREIAMAGSNGVKIAELVDPGLNTDEKKAIWFNTKVKQDPDLGVLANGMNSPEGLIDAVLYTKSTVVPDVASSLHAQVVAPNNPALQEVEKNKAFLELTKLKKDINNPVTRDKILEDVYPNKLERETQIKTLQLKTMNMAPKDALAAETSFYRDMALISLSKKKASMMVSDVTSWDAATVENLNRSPTLAPVLVAAKTSGLQPSLENLIATIYKIPDLATRQARIAELRQLANTAVNQQNKGLYGQVPSNSLDAEINRATMRAMGITPYTAYGSTGEKLEPLLKPREIYQRP